MRTVTHCTGTTKVAVNRDRRCGHNTLGVVVVWSGNVLRLHENSGGNALNALQFLNAASWSTVQQRIAVVES